MAPATTETADSATAATKMTPTVSVPEVDQVQQLRSVCTVACVEVKAPVQVASRSAIWEDEDEELEFDAPPGLEIRKLHPHLWSMFNDIYVTKNGKTIGCISNAREVSDYAKEFQRGHWSFLGLGDEAKWYGMCN